VRDYLANNLRSDIDTPIGDRLREEGELAELRRRQELARTRYDDTVSKLEQVQLQASAEATAQERGFRIIDPPAMPSESVRQRRALFLPIGLAVAGSLALAIGVTFLRTWFDPTMRSSADVTRLTGLATLGSLPRFRPSRRSSRPAGATVNPLEPVMAGTPRRER
jgi:hypothetical protein